MALITVIAVSTILGSAFTLVLLKTSTAGPAPSLFTYTTKLICNAPVLPQFSRASASGGTGNGQFSAPVGVAVDSSGNVYVADTGNNRVQKFTSTGSFILTWGSFGSGNGQFNDPDGIAVDSSGNVYVTDLLNNRVQKFTGTGSFILTWGSFGTGNGQFSAPFGVAVDSSGNVYVADIGNNRVQKFTSTGAFITTWGVFGTGNGQFNGPFGVAVDSSSGNVYVVDRLNNRVQKFTGTGSFILTWGSSGSGNSQFSTPFGVAVDSSGNVYVADSGNNRVQKFTSTGSFILTWGSFGTGNGQFSTPAGVAVDSSSGNVYVADTFNSRVQVFAVAEPAYAERIGLVPGEYKTDINVHNPSHSATLTITKRLVLSVAESQEPTINPNATVTLTLRPDGAFFMDCTDITILFSQQGIVVPHTAKGFLVLTTTTDTLNVLAEYSAESFDPTQVSTGLSLDVERVPSQPFVA